MTVYEGVHKVETFDNTVLISCQYRQFIHHNEYWTWRLCHIYLSDYVVVNSPRNLT